MKRQKIAWLFTFIIFTVAVTFCSNHVTAKEDVSYNTTLTDSDGLDIDVADVNAADVLGMEEYIKANIDTNIVGKDKLEAKDIILVKNVIADGTIAPNLQSTTELWEQAPESYLFLNDYYVSLYETSENSDYYVAYVNSMLNDSNAETRDIVFAYANNNAEVISDGIIYDDSTGLAYIPKKYAENNKNGMDLGNLQTELFQVVNSSYPQTTFTLKITKDDEISGKVAQSGYATVNSFASHLAIQVATDTEAKRNIVGDNLRVLVNGNQINKYDYYPSAGILTIEEVPGNVINVEVQVLTKEQAEKYVDIFPEQSFMSTQEMIQSSKTGVWEVSERPKVGSVIRVYEANSKVSYDAWDHESKIGATMDDLELYGYGSDSQWKTMPTLIKNGIAIDFGKVQKLNSWIQWNIVLWDSITAEADGVRYTIPAGNWGLKCAHTTLTLDVKNYTSSEYVSNEEIAKVFWVRIYEVSDNYMIVGMVIGGQKHAQSGGGLFKVGYTGANGKLEFGKRDDHGQLVSGARIAINGPEGYYTEVTTNEGTQVINELKPGSYTVQEIGAPNNMVLNSTPVTVQVNSGDTPTQVMLSDNYQRGSVRLQKYDQQNEGNTKGDATLAGAKYELRAASDIYEGRTFRYSANQVVATVETNENGDTNTISNLPIGNYYYTETKSSTGFRLNSSRFDVSVDYTGQNSVTATEKVVRASEVPTTHHLKITKKLAATDYDPEINLAGAQFTITLKSDSNQKYVSNITGEDGIATVNNIPYGEYTISETLVPDEAYKIDDFDVFFSEDNKTYEFTKVDKSKEMKIAVNKKLIDEVVGKTDAKVSGAYFTVYTDAEAKKEYKDANGKTVIIGPTNNTGYAISGTMRSGTYYIKETTFPEGINPDAKVPGEDITYREKIYKAFVDNKTQVNDVVTVEFEKITNIPNFGRVRVIKYNDDPKFTDESAAQGAKLRLKLNSKSSVYYDGVVDAKGYVEFRYEDVAKYDSTYTIPYGEYTITEINESDVLKHYFVQPENIIITNNHDDEKRILSDNPVPAWLRLIKIDKDTGKVSKLEGAKFKIWNVEEKAWVKQMITPSGKIIDEFTTANSGTLTTPEKVQPGKYVIYETQSPDGYYLQDNLRVPADEADLGNTAVSGQEVIIDKIATGLAEDDEYPEGGIATGALVVDVKLPDEPLKVKLTIEKKGEKLTQTKSENVTYKTGENEENSEEKITPIYEMVGLEGVEYTLYAKEDVKTPDGIERYKKDEAVATIVTGEDGIGTSKPIYPGEYRVVETKTPSGYVTDTNIPNVILENKDQYVKVVESKKALTNIRQKLGLTFKKIFKETKYSNSADGVKEALFGVYTKDSIKYSNGNVAIAAGKLVDLIKADENGDVTSTIDLPEGKYIVKELYVSFPYIVAEETEEFELKYNNNTKDLVNIVSGKNLVNTPVETDLTLVKLSSSKLGEILVVNGKTEIKGKDEKISELIEEFNGKTVEQVKELLKENNLNGLKCAEYTLYLDKDCTKPVYIENKVANLVSDEEGIMELEEIPTGMYFIKETKAPEGYEVSDEIVEISLDAEDQRGVVYKILSDEKVLTTFITKKDIFTSEYVPNCTFEIKEIDSEKVLMRSVTDKNGEARIPTDLFKNGKTYTYIEIDAPEIYDLNLKPHEFTAKFNDNGEWIVQHILVENVRKKGTVKLEKTELFGGDKIKNCTFRLESLETDFKVEGTTDENGEYFFEDIPYGRYTYTEISAPEEYNLDTTPHEFTVSEKMTILQITNEKNPELPETGDIAVIAIACIGLLSIAGIIFVVVKNKKRK